MQLRLSLSTPKENLILNGNYVSGCYVFGIHWVKRRLVCNLRNRIDFRGFKLLDDAHLGSSTLPVVQVSHQLDDDEP